LPTAPGDGSLRNDDTAVKATPLWRTIQNIIFNISTQGLFVNDKKGKFHHQLARKNIL
jgi:hypothetical protein